MSRFTKDRAQAADIRQIQSINTFQLFWKMLKNTLYLNLIINTISKYFDRHTVLDNVMLQKTFINHRYL